MLSSAQGKTKEKKHAAIEYRNRQKIPPPVAMQEEKLLSIPNRL
jgi:hypothetical protein